MDAKLLKEQAWIGDAVLALYARSWILENTPASEDRTETFKCMTSNQFLSGIGEPTSVEAGIGRVYEKNGLQAAFDYIESTLLPLFKKQQNKRKPGRR
jgi:dsRNA-specific ribonuclease